MKKKVGIIIVIIFSIFCICMGIKTRKENAINVTQIQTQNSESLSYMLKTKKAIPDFDLFTGGFPCQPFSSAGLMQGENENCSCYLSNCLSCHPCLW